jgi:hypothetical protein
MFGNILLCCMAGFIGGVLVWTHIEFTVAKIERH